MSIILAIITIKIYITYTGFFLWSKSAKNSIGLSKELRFNSLSVMNKDDIALMDGICNI